MTRSCEYMRRKGFQKLPYCILEKRYVFNCVKRDCDAYKKAKGIGEVKRMF